MLTPHRLHPPLPPLRLLLHHHRRAVHAQHPHPTLKQPLVQIVRLARPLGVVCLGALRARFQGVVAAAEEGGAVQAQDVTGRDAWHVEGEAERVAGGEEVGEAVDVRGYVVRGLGGEVGEEVLDGFGEDERFLREWRRR